MAQKERKVNNKFSYDANNSDYDFQLKKKPNLWWLLLLLLPLLLLIPLKKDITVYTQLDGQAEPYVDVSMNYTARYLLWDKKFNVKMPYDTIQQTDSTGRTVFKGIGYSVYSFIFHFKTPIVFSTNGGNCYDPLEKSCRFHTTRKVVLDMEPKVSDVRLKVVDKELRFELPGATVECEYQGKKSLQKTVDTTDAAGCVVLKDARVCSEFNSIKVSAEGYADTLLSNLQVVELLKDAGGYVIPLRPLKERFIFYVKNVYTKEPIPGALAEVTLTLNGQVGSGGESKTNVDGLGQGFFDNACVLATIGIKASKQGYYDSVYVAPQGKPITVKEFVKLADDDRVVWLRPKPQTVQFRNVDTLSNQPIAGVHNEIVIVGIDGKTRGPKVEISNRNGYFSVTALPGDKITINSTFDPYYDPKTTVVDKFEGKEEIIYMHPVHCSLEFRTLDGTLTPMPLLENCDLVVTVDGRRVEPENSGNGCFTVYNVRLISRISIVASKNGYNTNDQSVRDEQVFYLFQAPIRNRDIPLDIERQCGNKYMSKGNTDDSQPLFMFPHIMGQTSGRFKFMFDTYDVGDAFEVWNCKMEEVGPANVSKRIYEWKEAISGDGVNGGVTTEWLEFRSGAYITVVAKRNVEAIAQGGRSNFEYVICCPGEDCPWPN